jgi:hypothetical protein
MQVEKDVYLGTGRLPANAFLFSFATSTTFAVKILGFAECFSQNQKGEAGSPLLC